MQVKNSRHLSPEQMENIAALFKVLGEPMRLRILQSVCKAPQSVNDIVTATGTTQANVSKHLALLASAGILFRKRAGQRVYYGVRTQLALNLCKMVRAQIVERKTKR